MSVTDKVIEIKCGGETYLDIDELTWFQGKLKSISEKDFKDLKESLKKSGLPYGFHVWRDDKKKNNISDGHHRWMALSELRKEGWMVPKVPVNFVKAKSKKEAAEMILIANSKYAKMSEESVSDFMIDFGLDYKSLEHLDFSDINVDYFIPNDSLSAFEDPAEMKEELERPSEKKGQELEQIPTANPNENVNFDEVKEEKMDVVGRRYVIIIDCKDQEQKDELREKLSSIVLDAGAKFF